MNKQFLLLQLLLFSITILPSKLSFTFDGRKVPVQFPGSLDELNAMSEDEQMIFLGYIAERKNVCLRELTFLQEKLGQVATVYRKDKKKWLKREEEYKRALRESNQRSKSIEALSLKVATRFKDKILAYNKLEERFLITQAKLIESNKAKERSFSSQESQLEVEKHFREEVKQRNCLCATSALFCLTLVMGTLACFDPKESGCSHFLW